MKIRISIDYSKTPGGRYITQGKYSGEDFRDKILIPKYKEALSKKEKLIIDFDGGYGYGVSFLEESFGGMVRKGFNSDEILKNMEFISNEEDLVIKKVTKYIKEAKKL